MVSSVVSISLEAAAPVELGASVEEASESAPPPTAEPSVAVVAALAAASSVDVCGASSALVLVLVGAAVTVNPLVL